MTSQQLMSISVENLCVDPRIYPRTTVHWQTSYNYYLAMRSGVKFPPITVTKIKGKYIVVDGVHRLKAAVMFQKFNKELNPLEVEEIQCKNLDEAYVEAVRRNMTHGRPLSPYEKLEINKRLKDMGWNKKSVATLLQIPPQKLDKIAAKRITQVGTKEVILKKTFAHLPPSAEISKENQKMFTGASQLSLVKQILTIVREGWLDTENKELTNLLTELKEALNALDL